MKYTKTTLIFVLFMHPLESSVLLGPAGLFGPSFEILEYEPVFLVLRVWLLLVWELQVTT